MTGLLAPATTATSPNGLLMSRKIVTWRDVGPCPCGYRPPKIDSIEGWSAWYDHLSEVHDDR